MASLRKYFPVKREQNCFILVRVAKYLSLSFLLVACVSGRSADEGLSDSARTSGIVGVASVQETAEAEKQHQVGSTPLAPEATAKAAIPHFTGTAPPTVTPLPTTAPTLTIAPTLTPTVEPSATPKPSLTTEPARYCPPSPPLKPAYDHFFLSPKKWQVPDEQIAGPHFWLSKPFPGAGRVLTNQRFPYGWDENGRLLLHNGVDMSEDLGTPVLAVADGTIVVAQSDFSAWYGWRCDWYGHLVVIELDQRWQDQPLYALYGHVLNYTVEPGQRVERGQKVAEVGVGGAATHPHLHFELRVGENEFGATRNPMLWLDPGPTRGVIAGRLVDPEGRPWQGVPLALVSADNGETMLSTWSYLGDPQDLINPDDGWAENFVFSDVPPGRHEIITLFQGVEYRKTVEVTAGEVAVTEMITEGYKTPTPEPSEAIVPTPTSNP